MRQTDLRLYGAAHGIWRGTVNGGLRVAQPDPSYRHSTLSFAVRAPVIGVPQARYTVPPEAGGYRAAEAGVPGKRLHPALQVLQQEN